MFLFFDVSATRAQSLEIAGGANMNTFYTFDRNLDFSKPKNLVNFGYSVSISMDDFKIGKLPLRISLILNNYRGDFHGGFSLAGGGTSTNATINKYDIGLDVYPVHVTFKKNFQVSIGGELNALLYDDIEGYQDTWGGPNFKRFNLADKTIRIDCAFTLGMVWRVAYTIALKNNWYIVPQYRFCWGLTNDFKNIEIGIKSIRNYLEVGVKKKFK